MATASTKTATPPPPLPPSPSYEKSILEVLQYPISLLKLIHEAVGEEKSFDCSEVVRKTDNIGEMLFSAVRIATATSPGSLYERPIRRIVAVVSRNFEEAIALVKKYRRRTVPRRVMTTVPRRVMTIVSFTDFKELLSRLDKSVADMKWLLSIFDGVGGTMFSFSPIASNDPIYSWIWTCIATLYMGQIKDEVEEASEDEVEEASEDEVEAAKRDKVEAAKRDKVEAAKRDNEEAANRDKVEAANQLVLLAQDNDRNKKIIVKEGGVPPLLKLLKDASPEDVQIASATTLLYLANDKERVDSIIDEFGVPIIVQVLDNSPAEVQILLAHLVARMAELSFLAKENFATENVMKPLVTLLSRDVFVDEPYFKITKHSFDSIVQMNKGLGRNQLHKGFGFSFLMHNEEGPEVKLRLRLKISCAEALWMLAKGSVLNSRRITETKGLLCLAKLVETGEGELLYNCLRAIMEITAAAETNSDLRRAAFKTNSPAAKAVVHQLLKLITDSDSPMFLIPAIKSIGSLARTFTTREARVIAPLVSHLWNRHLDVATEAAIALEKFACPENFLCMKHSKKIIKLKGLVALMRLSRGNEQPRLHSLILLCYLVLHARNIEAQELEPVLIILESALRNPELAVHPELGELIPKAVYNLNVYHSGLRVRSQSYFP